MGGWGGGPQCLSGVQSLHNKCFDALLSFIMFVCLVILKERLSDINYKVCVVKLALFLLYLLNLLERHLLVFFFVFFFCYSFVITVNLSLICFSWKLKQHLGASCCNRIALMTRSFLKYVQSQRNNNKGDKRSFQYDDPTKP